MIIKVIAVGKIKEEFYREAIREYTKRLSGYSKVTIVEVKDEPVPERASEVEKTKILEKEAERIFKSLDDSDTVITLEIEGKRFSSEAFAEELRQLELRGKSRVAFIIGGSLGLSDEIKRRAALPVSFSDMTFPHQLMRVILLEQIYRACKINAGEPYHK